MALISSTISPYPFYLKSYHRFGRLTGAVDTLLASPAISKVHAVIEWENQRWQLRDQSKNGCWLNDHKLQKGESTPLKPGDIIQLCNTGEHVFKMLDVQPPQNLLLPTTANVSPEDAVLLSNYNLLPNEKDLQVALYFNDLEQQWYYEDLTTQQPPKKVFNGEQILMGSENWRLQLFNNIDETQLLEHHEIAQLSFRFDLSLDEESTRLQLQTPDNLVDFKVRSHHYLTLHLAREKALHAQQGIDAQSQGWVDMELLSRDLGMDTNHLNILIHRARKQFTDQVKQVDNADRLFERQSGKIRFGGEHFTIYKGANLECQFPKG